MSLGSVDILGVRVHAVTYEQALAGIAQWIDQAGSRQVVTANPEFVMAAQKDEAFRQVLNQADLCVPDGVGLLWAARMLGRPLPERVTGSDLVPMIAALPAGAGKGLFLLGAAPGVARKAADVLQARNPHLRIAGVHAGSPDPAEAPAIVRRVREANPGVLLVAYGAPAQDLWIARHRSQLMVPVMMGVGGAFDHLAGVRSRAPAWVQGMNLEWFYRLLTQPWRWRRQLALPRFVLRVLRARYFGG